MAAARPAPGFDSVQPLPPDRSTPRFGKGPLAPTLEDASDSSPDSSDPRQDTVITDRRKQQLVADALSNPHERLYDAIGPHTHRNLQIAADKNVRRSWADSISGVDQRISQVPPMRDNRWVPPALVIAGIALIALGGWLWTYKAERSAAAAAEAEMTRGELPPARSTRTTDPDSSPRVQRSERAEEAPHRTIRAAKDPAATTEASPTQGARAGNADAPTTTSTSRSAEPERKRPSKTSRATDQSIFTEAPF